MATAPGHWWCVGYHDQLVHVCMDSEAKHSLDSQRHCDHDIQLWLLRVLPVYLVSIAPSHTPQAFEPMLTTCSSYIPMSYPQYAASLFAGNDFFRAMFAFGAVLFSRSMFVDLGVDKGVTLLAGLSVMGIVSAQQDSSQESLLIVLQIGWFVLYFYGAKLRARSKFALS